MKTAQKAAEIPSIVKVGRRNETRNRRTMLIIMVKSPSVSIMKGNEKNLITGLMKVFMTPRSAPAVR